MARMPRVVLPGYPHHLTQRGNWRLSVFREEADYLLYLDLLQEYAQRFELRIAGNCLMTNHVHVVGEPQREDSLARTFKSCHGVYATEFNRKYRKRGHLWQARPFSCVLDEPHAWTALRYVERNPVPAHMVERAEDYRWSSAAAHCGLRNDPLLDATWPREGIPPNRRLRLVGTGSIEDEQRLRERTYTGRPCGDADFIKSVEAATGRILAPSKRGPKADTTEANSLPLSWLEDES